MSGADIVELNQLAYRYAAAVDRCDVELFQGVFLPHGRLRAYHPDADVPFADLHGSEQLAAIPNAMRGAHRHTAHMMTNHLIEVDGDHGTGEVLCTARHLSQDREKPVSLNVIIRYIDRYERYRGEWKIADRQIRFLWSEIHETANSGFGNQ